MNLVPEWRWLVRKAWSVRLVVLSAVLSGCEVILPLFVDSMPRHAFAVLSMVAAIGAGVARVMVQPTMDRRAPTDGDRRAKKRSELDAEKADSNG
jgi:hypothetical protein